MYLVLPPRRTKDTRPTVAVSLGSPALGLVIPVEPVPWQGGSPKGELSSHFPLPLRAVHSVVRPVCDNPFARGLVVMRAGTCTCYLLLVAVPIIAPSRR